MSKVFVCSEPDLPSVNMRDQLLKIGGWEDAGTQGKYKFHYNGEDYILSTPDLHIFTDGLDDVASGFGINVDVVIFMSKHSAASGDPALTVHPIGNYHENLYGGKEKGLVRPCPSLMTDAMRCISKYCDMPEFQKCFEVTHHGPWLEKPTFFIEIGSDERNWGNIHAAEILAKVLTDMGENDYPNVVGVAGGHYAPRFTEVALSYQVNFGHMVPNYQIEGRDDEDVLRILHDATSSTGTNMVYLHRNSLRKPLQHHLVDLIEGAGYDMIRSADLEPINGN